jgi:two-component system phosphate regulon sensor histidine kinase PhoR
MKNNSPQSIALIAALILAVFATAVVIILNYFILAENNLGVPLVVFPATFMVTYLVFQFTIERFIYDKIKLIYKTIHNLKTNDSADKSSLNLNTDILSEVNEEVLQWAKVNRDEIDNLKKLEVYRREFLGNVSHELKTPIFNIQGYILTLLDGGLSDPKINKDYLMRTERSVDRMITIVEDLEAISQLETGELSIEKEKFDIVALTRDVFESQELKAKSGRIILKFNDVYDKPIFVKADRFRIRQVITNLIVNSIKYGKDDGETEVRFYDMDENILIEIADNGIGIDKVHLPRLFERFYRVDKGRSREQGGTGLGLAIVKHIIEAHNQTINVRSTKGVGSTFGFTLQKG